MKKVVLMGRDKLINVHAVISASRVNGPGKRLVVFFQGCNRKCRCCFNPDTHSFKKNQLYSAKDILKNFLLPDTEGITISGGEPFLQVKGLLQLLKAAKEEYGLSTVVYTGFCYENIIRQRLSKDDKHKAPSPGPSPARGEGVMLIPPPLTGGGKGEGERRHILNYLDVLIDGAYEADKKEPSLLARGSSNQRFLFFSDRYQQKDFSMPAKVEIIISRDGTIRETGFSKVELWLTAENKNINHRGHRDI